MDPQIASSRNVLRHYWVCQNLIVEISGALVRYFDSYGSN